MPRMSKEAKKQLEARRRTVLQLAIAGGSLRGISQQLAAQYGVEVSHQTVKTDLDAMLKELAELQVETVPEYRALMNERYNRLLVSWWEKAVGGGEAGPDGGAMDRVMKILEAARKLNGVDAPVALSLEGTDGGPVVFNVRFTDKEIPIKQVETEE